nr:uncharacterized protein LOC116771014 [Danaus plexippus plexippus]
MSNININVALTNKKKKKKRKRKFLLPQPNPQSLVVDTPMTRIAALFKLQQQLTNKNKHTTYDRPLMSGPRFSPHMKWVNKKFMNPQAQIRNSTPLSAQQNDSDTSNRNENDNLNASTSKNEISQNTTAQISNQLSEPVASSSLNTSGQDFPVYDSKITNFNQNMHTNYKFHECEVYDSPSFINFESEEGVTDLNDDDIFNKNLSKAGDETNKNQQDINAGFKLKLQDQYPKIAESINQDTKIKQISMSQTDKESNVIKKELPQNDSNQDNLPPATSDSNKVVRESIHANICEQSKHIETTQAQNVQNFFMHNTDLGPMQFQGYTSNNLNLNQKIFVQTDESNVSQLYSPSDVYEGLAKEDSPDSESVTRTSAFQRLGPPEKKPRLTINVSVDTDHSIRDVSDGSGRYIPAHEKQELLESKDGTVLAFLPTWPWKNSIVTRKTVSYRSSKTLMMMNKEYMEEKYEKDSAFFLIAVEGYPEQWTKEDVLDLVLDHLKGKHFVPCFIEFTPKECKFFVIRSKGALLTIHSLGFVIRRDNIEVRLSIAQTVLTLRQIDFLPRIVLRSRLCMGYDGESKLDLSEFTLKTDISHFIYYPLHRNFNQTELIHLPSSVSWHTLTELILSHNKITCIEGFNLDKSTPRLNALDLSHNNIESVLSLLPIRQLHLLKLSLEENPLCYDYIESDHYVKVLKSIFSSLREIDGIQIIHDFVPNTKQNYCPEDCRNIVEKFLEVFFPLLECSPDDRRPMQSMYADNAVMTVTHRGQLRYNTSNKLALNLLIKNRNILTGDLDYIQGSSNILKLLKKWPNIQHDPSTFTVDVVYSTDTYITFTINGVFKVTAETLAENESLLTFARTVTLYSANGFEYKITNEMVHIDEPYYEWEKKAFQIVSIPKRALCFKFDSTPDENTKTRLIYILMKITNANEKQCESYLVDRNWNFKEALELFTQAIKANNIETIH